MPSARLAVDIGGTFTDLALEHAGTRSTTKVLTTPHAPEQGVMQGVRSILRAAGLAPADIAIVIHGTTLATNAIIERKGARTALITTEGFRDVLAMGNESRYDQYDLNIVLPEPLVPRYLRLPVPERLDNFGEVLRSLDEAALRSLVPLLRREDVESIAVGFLHAFVNAAHERRAREILADELPDVPVSLSSEVSPEMREWERFSTTVANAYVQPLMARYLRRLRTRPFRGWRRRADVPDAVGRRAHDDRNRLPLPDPAGRKRPGGRRDLRGPHRARKRAASVLCFDMGGTTAKICLIDDFRPQTSRSFEVARIGRFRKGSGLPLRIPVIEMVEIGAGGGSLAHVDALGRIAVGPESAGADPGPACYGARRHQARRHRRQSRARPLRSDALRRRHVRARRGAARRRWPRMSASRSACHAGMAALGVIEMVDENMANAARVHAIESGKTYAGRTMIAFGGGGPVHGSRVAEKIGIARVLVPSGAGVGSAIGFLRAPGRL